MSFYKRRPAQMGLVWLAPVVDFVSGALRSQPIEGGLPPVQTNPLVPIAIGVVGLGVVGGLIYILVKK